MPSSTATIDPEAPPKAETLIESTLDPLQVICLPRPTASSGAAAVIGLANALGGQVWFGVRSDTSGKTVRALPGVDPLAADALLREICQRIDPPMSDLVSTRTLPVAGGLAVLVVSVRQSAAPPHIDAVTGRIFLRRPDGTRPVASRVELDAIYKKGRAAGQRAERLIEAQIERLSLAQFGCYGVAVVACSAAPDAASYLWARERPDALTDAADPFMRAWGFSERDVHVHPGEVELRSEREVAGVVRVSRSGSAVVGEIRRRASGDFIGPLGELSDNLRNIVEAACRLLSHADSTAMIAHLYCDGLKGVRLPKRDDLEKDSAPCDVDTVQRRGPAGDSRDPEYRRRLHAGFLQQIVTSLRQDRSTPADA